MKTVLITGVSSGIGYDAARFLVEKGFRVFGSVRKEADATRLQTELGHNFTPLIFDVTDGPAIKTAVETVTEQVRGQGLVGLVNNAGIATPGPLQYLPLDDLRQQLEVNVVGVTAVTQAFLPLLGASFDRTFPPGRIVNISSVSGKISYPFMGAYAASKHALEALSDAWRRELMLFGIDIILIEPGTVQTPIIYKFKTQLSRFEHSEYGSLFKTVAARATERESDNIPVTKISRIIHQALTHPRPKSRYPVPRRWLTGWFLPRTLPDRWMDWLTAKQLGIDK